MAITTLDGAIAGMQPPRAFAKAATTAVAAGKVSSLWGVAGVPGAGAQDTTLNGIVLSQTSAAVNGALPFTDPGGGVNSYLARFVGGSTVAGRLLLCDRLWNNGGFTITSNGSQGITSPTFPARDANGATAGAAVLLGLEISAQAGNATPTITVSYANSTATGGTRTGTNLDATTANPVAGTFYRIGLQAGDQGVGAVSALQLSVSWVSGTMNLVAYRVLAEIDATTANVSQAVDSLTGGFPRLYNGTTPFLLFVTSAASAASISGSYVVTQG